MYSMDVKADGKNVFRLLDIMLHNGSSPPTNTPPGPNLQPPAVALPPNQDPEKKKITDVKWGDQKLKCGDLTLISTKTENYDDGEFVFHTINLEGTTQVKALVKGERRNLRQRRGRAVDYQSRTVAKGPRQIQSHRARSRQREGKQQYVGGRISPRERT
jgi:hypothetical protein